MKKSEFLKKLYTAVKMYDQLCSDRYEKIRIDHNKEFEIALEAGSNTGIIRACPINIQKNPIIKAIIAISHSELQHSVLPTLIQSELAWEYFRILH